MGKKKEKSSNSWLVKTIIFLIFIVLVIFGYAVSKELYRKKEVDNKIKSLKQQAEKIKQENMQISEKLSYLGSQDYQKMEAKEKLNLQNPGEKIVVLSQNPVKIKKEIIPTVKHSASLPINSMPNFQKWWNYFFE